MIYDAEFCRQIRVTEEKIRDCLALISEIIHLATGARNYGLLSLGKQAEENESFLLRKGLQLALDGVKSAKARTILELYSSPTIIQVKSCCSAVSFWKASSEFWRACIQNC